MKRMTKEDWLVKMPELIYKLKKEYNFYFSGLYSHIKKDILEITKKSKSNHKICLYNRNNRFFLVVYTKTEPVIYFTNEYQNDTKHNRIRYFIKKFTRAYKKAEADYEVQFVSTKGDNDNGSK